VFVVRPLLACGQDQQEKSGRKGPTAASCRFHHGDQKDFKKGERGKPSGDKNGKARTFILQLSILFLRRQVLNWLMARGF
jgi:hypothetical protein